MRSIREDCVEQMGADGSSLLLVKRTAFFGALRNSDLNIAGEPVKASINVPGTEPQERIQVCVEKCLPQLYDVSNI